MRQWTVEGTTVRVGDWVGFKQDIEQSGKITAIRRNGWNGVEFVLENEDGFYGEYIGGQTKTTEDADRCWVD